MAAWITTFVLRPRTSRTRIAGLTYADVEDPGDLVNSEQEIPGIAAYGIQKNAVWDSVISRSDGDAPKSTQNNAIGHLEANDVASDIRLPTDIDLADQLDEEEETNGVLFREDVSLRRLGKRLRTSRENGTPTMNKTRISVGLRPGRGDDHLVGEIDEDFIQ
jgi:hypothetical protein